MSQKEIAFNILNHLTDEQINAFIVLFGGNILGVASVTPDEIDKALLLDSKIDNDEVVSLNHFAEELGFNPNDLRA